MIPTPALIVATNAHAARYFVRGGDRQFHELPELSDTADLIIRRPQQAQQSQASLPKDSVKTQTRLVRHARKQFLQGVAAHIGAIARQHGCDALVIAAPARELSALRDLLAPAAVAKIEREIYRDLVGASSQEIQSNVEQALAAGI